MTKEEKQLLLRDLCARLPYGVKLGFENSNVVLTPKDYCCFTWQLFTNKVFPEHDGTVEYGCQFYEYRPYLRPMSSMTKEELIDFREIVRRVLSFTDSKVDFRYWHWNINSSIDFNITMEAIDWLLSHHFDYRGLIEKGLALEAPEDMYKQ